MIACAEWLGRDHTTCTRKPDGCVCEPKEPVCTCSDGPYHYSTCPMYKEGHDPFAALGKAMTKHAPTPNPYCGINGGCTTWCGDIACKRHNHEVSGGEVVALDRRVRHLLHLEHK